MILGGDYQLTKFSIILRQCMHVPKSTTLRQSAAPSRPFVAGRLESHLGSNSIPVSRIIVARITFDASTSLLKRVTCTLRNSGASIQVTVFTSMFKDIKRWRTAFITTPYIRFWSNLKRSQATNIRWVRVSVIFNNDGAKRYSLMILPFYPISGFAGSGWGWVLVFFSM